MVIPPFLTLSTVMLPLLIPSPTRECQFGRMGDPAGDERVIANFEAAVEAYVDLHRRLERGWPSFWFISDPEQAEFTAEEFRRVLQDARPLASPGNFFRPEVAEVLRFRIGEALRKWNLDATPISMAREEGETYNWWTPIVNERAPVGSAGAEWPIFENLPPLPFELEYRLVGRDLVLLDVHANMVLDVLELLLPAYAVAEEPREY